MSAPVAYLLDTNVLSETRKKKADAGVISFLQSAEASSLTSAFSRWASCEKASPPRNSRTRIQMRPNVLRHGWMALSSVSLTGF